MNLLTCNNSDYVSVWFQAEQGMKADYSYSEGHSKTYLFPVGDVVDFWVSLLDISQQELIKPKLVFSQRAYELLKDKIQGSVVTQINGPDQTFYHIHPPLKEPVLDAEGNMDWDQTAKLFSEDVLCLRFSGERPYDMFVSEAFRQLVEEHQLLGFEFMDQDDNIYPGSADKAFIKAWKKQLRERKQALASIPVELFHPQPQTAFTQADYLNLIEQLGQQFTQAGLSRIWPEIKETSQYSIRIQPEAIEDHKIMLGQSKWGGQPDLPPKVKWSKFKNSEGDLLHFVGQLNFAEFKHLDLNNQFPDQGILYIFCDNHPNQSLGPWPCRGHFAVHYYEGDMSLLKRHDFPNRLDPSTLSASCKLSFTPEVSITHWNHAANRRIAMTNEESHLFKQFDDCEKESHKLLGYPDHPMDATAFEDYGLLLLQVDSSQLTQMDWAEASGRLHFFIQAKDLAAKRFNKTMLVVTYT